ncbi:MAG: hypothetical protein AAF108_06630 [Planctomycetota bacterium]
MLGEVGLWLGRFADTTIDSGTDAQRFCRDVAEWVRDLHHEMLGLREQFCNDPNAAATSHSLATAVSRLASSTTPLGDRAKRLLTSQRPDDEQVRPAHVERASEIRGDVAQLRERLRRQRAEEARQDASRRRAFVESIRRSVGTHRATDVVSVGPIAQTTEPPPTPAVISSAETAHAAPTLFDLPIPEDNNASVSESEPHTATLDTRPDEADGRTGTEPERRHDHEAANDSSERTGDTEASNPSDTDAFFRRTDSTLSPAAPTSGGSTTSSEDAARGIRFRRVD